MRIWQFYAIWVTRNGQHLWSGPFMSEERAQGVLDALLYCTGQRVLRDSVEQS